jgi:hypothetical protein
VGPDLVQAWVWLRAAADQGATPALSELNEVQAQLTPLQLENAKKSAVALPKKL